MYKYSNIGLIINKNKLGGPILLKCLHSSLSVRLLSGARQFHGLIT